MLDDLQMRGSGWATPKLVSTNTGERAINRRSRAAAIGPLSGGARAQPSADDPGRARTSECWIKGFTPTIGLLCLGPESLGRSRPSRPQVLGRLNGGSLGTVIAPHGQAT